MSFIKRTLNRFSLEMIDYQDKDPVVEKLTNLFDSYQQGRIDDAKLKSIFSRTVEERFGILNELTIERDRDVNAYAQISGLNDNSVLMGYNWFNNWYLREYKDDIRRKYMIQILKGDIPSTGVIDYKKAKISGVFNFIKINFGINKGTLAKLAPHEITSVMMHEIGHAWSYFEFTAITMFRNAIIHNRTREILNCSKEDRIQILISEKNDWGLDVDPAVMADADNEDFEKVYVGAWGQKFMQDTGYVQYNQNTSEAVADQFASRFGIGGGIISGLDRYVEGQTEAISGMISFDFWSSVAMVVGSIGAVLSGAAVGAGVVFGIIGTIGLIGSFMSANEFANGWTYDNVKRRYQRIYNETVGFIKKSDMTAERTKELLKQLTDMKKVIDKTAELDSFTLKIIRWCSASFRSNEAKRLHQEITEDLMANDLYVIAAKMKTI